MITQIAVIGSYIVVSGIKCLIEDAAVKEATKLIFKKK